ncbi:MAG TPA: hypothetical protein PLZ05_00915 [Alphaproteobacteria bacterium]|nr:hypothetical protein [Alphaproteobacteria bacterium]
MLDKVDPQTVSNIGPNVLAIVSLGVMFFWAMISIGVDGGQGNIRNIRENRNTKTR